MKSNMSKILTTAAIAATVSATAGAATLDDVKSKGFIQCGVSQGVPGFSNADEAGNWSGIDVDACRAAAAAVFGDAQAVKFTPLSAKERFTALQSGEIDMLSRNTTWTYTRDTALGLDFTAVNFYDGQGFMVRNDLGVTSAMELDGATVCTEQGTTTELNMADFFRKHGLSYVPVIVQKADEALAAYASGRCDVFTTDKSGLAAHRSKLADPSAHVILPETISKEPLGPVVRHGDNQWKDIVTWAMFVQVNAEEMGISSKNVAKIKAESKDPAIRRLLGAEGNMGESLGLGADWAYDIIAEVGNYGEVFENNVGPNTPVGLPRGINNLWTEGGVMYAPPVR
ncbi:amino acid ABC transporter substrate-binding protein [Marinomonas mediterranea]|jgi:ABC-type amino acid transport/signal transduction systems, periplasmic component/domain|uniref:ABC-type transporter, periplasmic subunit family 3 n=1 Tax=Marinomonas mediterranea (strain ATCC 700492 / JCM 21426 / NBRC 103028 / MMB-1) TaxID=717774 RepID=F2K0Y6_MARM1|nr:amino acid ABC transporter substrate-binding protein [Marinomonas mediterranea]ADZ93335.1 ABC-type transporter, periplasmic subunit family 3 [Marinomonas mediterranea MMB-1]WCN11224.1 transporter substrate-binding domain-containing protein [Marinomonas mediterranea]WCN15286.1 transporter substrate-binding domain-containing protein [Marinomonas mediterranea]WCN19331.1 transporter substrate-binding domain-containing protein [Marinomonas mediterranea MMB-1]